MGRQTDMGPQVDTDAEPMTEIEGRYPVCVGDTDPLPETAANAGRR